MKTKKYRIEYSIVDGDWGFSALNGCALATRSLHSMKAAVLSAYRGRCEESSKWRIVTRTPVTNRVVLVYQPRKSVSTRHTYGS